MFGRKSNEERELARRTVGMKVDLMDALLCNTEGRMLWPLNGDHVQAQSAVKEYAKRVLETDDVVFLTLNSFSADF